MAVPSLTNGPRKSREVVAFWASAGPEFPGVAMILAWRGVAWR
ncbi:MAG: hypothetical protein QOE61_1323, partial [Micromonosporaceae bacterium]|nr:hypothetical protein [Micromonosporaceae bacterium]